MKLPMESNSCSCKLKDDFFPINFSMNEIWKNTKIKSKNSFVSSIFSSVQSLSRVRLFVTPWTAAHHASLSITNSRSSPKLMSIESVMPSNHLILYRPLLLPSVFPSIRVFSNESQLLWLQFFTSGSQSIGVSASASVFPMNIQDWFPLGWTGWISLQSKGLSRVFSNTTVQNINSWALSFLSSPTHIHTWLLKYHSFD